MRLVQIVDEFLSRPLVAHVATNGPTVRPVWFLWEDAAFWWLTGPWSVLAKHLSQDSRVALIVDTCDVSTGEVVQIAATGSAELRPLDRSRAERKLAKYLGEDVAAWPARFKEPLTNPTTGLVRMAPNRPLVIRDLSYDR